MDNFISHVSLSIVKLPFLGAVTFYDFPNREITLHAFSCNEESTLRYALLQSL